MNTIRYELDANGIATLTFDEPGSPVNTMRPEWQDDMAEAAAQLERDKERIKGVLLASAKTTFFAGAELKGVLKLKAEDAADGFKRIEALKRSFRRIETLVPRSSTTGREEGQTSSTMVAMPMPPPTHSVARPRLRSRRSSSSMIVPRIIAPVAPSG